MAVGLIVETGGYISVLAHNEQLMEIIDGYTNPYHIYLVNIEMFRLDSVYEILAALIRLSFSIFLLISYVILATDTSFDFSFSSIVYFFLMGVFIFSILNDLARLINGSVNEYMYTID